MSRYYKFCGTVANPVIVESNGDLFKVDNEWFYIEFDELYDVYVATEFETGLKVLENKSKKYLENDILKNIEKIRNTLKTEKCQNIIKIKKQELLNKDAENFKKVYKE